MKSFASPECKTAHRHLRDTLDVVGGKWKLIILSMLLDRPWRFKELMREIKISPRILSKELQELEMHQLITRTVRDTRPVTVEYAATDYSHSLSDVIQAMHAWGKLHQETIVGKKQPVLEEA